MNDSQRKQIWKLRADGQGYGTIGKAVGLSKESVKAYCRRNPELLGFGAATKQMAKERQERGKHCPQCCQPLIFKKTGRPKKFCSDKCRKVWWNRHSEEHDKEQMAYYELTCQHCGGDFISYANADRKFCGHPCYIQSRFYKESET